MSPANGTAYGSMSPPVNPYSCFEALLCEIILPRESYRSVLAILR